LLSSNFYVYALYRDTEMTLPFYIGKGKNSRMQQHGRPAAKETSHRANTCRQIIRTLGYLPMRKIAEGLTEPTALALEIALIAQFGPYPDGILLNRLPGGDGLGGIGRRWTDEERAKVSATLKGRKKAPEHAAKVAAAQRGKIVSIETRAKLSARHCGRPAHNKGKPHTPETRAKLSLALAGKKRGPRPPEVGRKISAAKIGKNRPPLSLEWREKIGTAQRGKPKNHSPEGRARTTAASLTPEALAKRARSATITQSRLWADPDYRLRQLAAIAEGQARSTKPKGRPRRTRDRTRIS
jgi:hypothetical protein